MFGKFDSFHVKQARESNLACFFLLARLLVPLRVKSNKMNKTTAELLMDVARERKIK